MSLTCIVIDIRFRVCFRKKEVSVLIFIEIDDLEVNRKNAENRNN